MPSPVTLADVRAARELLDGVSIYTPMQSSRWLSALVGGPVLMKAENLQRTGSFKIRGAYVRMSHLSEEEKARGVVAASAGNHAQGVALAAQMLDIKATVFMPEGAPIPKLNATRGYGAEVRLDPGLPGIAQALLTDPQTSGGLLVSCAPKAVDAVLGIFQAEGFAEAAVVGHMERGPAGLEVRA